MLELWYEALSSDHGIAVECGEEPPATFAQKLYRSRREANDPELDSISISQSPTSGSQLWLVKRAKEI